MEQGLEQTRQHELKEKALTESLASATTLAKLQGTQNKSKEQTFKFEERIRDLDSKLKILADDQVEFLLNENKKFIKQS